MRQVPSSARKAISIVDTVDIQYTHGHKGGEADGRPLPQIKTVWRVFERNTNDFVLERSMIR